MIIHVKNWRKCDDYSTLFLTIFNIWLACMYSATHILHRREIFPIWKFYKWIWNLPALNPPPKIYRWYHLVLIIHYFYYSFDIVDYILGTCIYVCFVKMNLFTKSVKFTILFTSILLFLSNKWPQQQKASQAADHANSVVAPLPPTTN